MTVDGSSDYGEHSPLTENPMVAAVQQFDEAQADLFASMTDYTGHPTRQRGILLNHHIETTRLAFHEVVLALAGDEELTIEERAKSIATWYFDAEKQRIDLCREIAPDGDYEESSFSSTVVAENIQDGFNAGLSAEDVASLATDSYAKSFAIDVNDLLDSARPNKRARAIYMAKDLGEQAIEIGKISAGVIIGGIILNKAFKQRR